MHGFLRVRRPADLLVAVLAIGAVVVTVGLVSALPTGSAEISGDVARFVTHLPRWLSSTAAVVAGIGAFLLVFVALVALLRRESRGALNAVVAALSAGAISIAAIAVWRSEHGVVDRAVLAGHNPAFFVLDAAFVAFLVGSDFVRRPRWHLWCVVSVLALALTGIAVNTLSPFALLLALVGGLSIGWFVRWLLGAASVRPAGQELVAWLAGRNVEVASLQGEDRRQLARLPGELPDGTSIELRIASRDTRGAGLARRLWALVRLRPGAAGHLALSARSQLEQLALICYLAQSAGVLAPSVLALGESDSGSLVLALSLPSSATGSLEDLRPVDAKALFTALRALHDAGVAHRDLRPERLLVNGGRVGFSSLDAAVPGAGAALRLLDLAQLLTTLGKAIGPAEAVRGYRDGYGPSDELAVAASLQPIALAPWGWSAMRAASACVSQVRRELAGDSVSAPIARLERFRWRTVLSAVALTVAAYLFVGQLSKVALLSALGRTNLGWFAVALLGSALTYLAAAENLAAFVPARLSPFRGFFVQLSTAFVGVAMPPTVGHVAVNARYLSRQHVREGSIAAAVALSQLINVATTVLLLVAIGLLTGTGLSRFHLVPGADVLIGAAATAAAIGVLLAIPATRRRFNRIVWLRLRNLWPYLLDAASQPLRLAAGIATSLLLTVGYVLAFVASLWALGAHPALLPVVVVYLAGNAVGSAAPTPGGLGAVEAVLAAGLTAIGVAPHEAIPAVLVFRVATFWLPIPAGWLSYLVLLRRGVL